MSTTQSTAYGFGIATQNQSGQTLECSFYALGLGKAPENKIDATFKSLIGEDPIRKVKKVAVEVVIQINEKPKDAADVYLRLHLLSHRLLKPHAINLEGIFSLLANVVWTSAGACEIDGFEKVRPQLMSKYANLVVYGVDKFPRMVDYVIPEGVRIADGDRVRLGAYLASGTTVMHEGFVNFNAGTLGTIAKNIAEDSFGKIQTSGVLIDEASYSAKLHGEPMDLTFKEFELLKFLAQHPGRVFTRDQLLSEVWGYDYFGGTRTVDVHIRRLRAKLGDLEGLISTVRNVGYRFNLVVEDEPSVTGGY